MDINEILNIEIVRELIREANDGVEESDEIVEFIWSTCNGLPFNGGILYQLMKIAGKI
jgi:hypothetical protein